MIILASKSPRRKELMNRITSSFKIATEEIDEEASYVLPPLEATKDISKRKALAVKDLFPNDIIVAADTIVVINNQIIGKPKDEDDAFRILKFLSGKKHEVITGYTIIKDNKIINEAVVTEVYFNDLDDTLIKSYIKTKSPLDKAGAYGIQDNDKYPIIDHISGSLDNVVGFPVDEIKRDLNL